MRKTDLKIGYVVEFRDGGKAIVGKRNTATNDLCLREYLSISGIFAKCAKFDDYNDNLKFAHDNDGDWDIVKVYDKKEALFIDCEPIWQVHPFESLEKYTPILVKTKHIDTWRIAMFLEVNEQEEVIATEYIGGTGCICTEYKLFNKDKVK